MKTIKSIENIFPNVPRSSQDKYVLYVPLAAQTLYAKLISKNKTIENK